MASYVLNTWYPAAWSRDIQQGLNKRRVVEQDIVLYRTRQSEVVAMEDMCPHRFLPLSMGKLKGDSIECGYHGMTFNCSGQCIRVPGQRTIPPRAKVRTYPVCEKMGLVWIWMGDPELADPMQILHLPQYDDPQWSVVEGDALEIGSNYLNLADNLCDPAHVSFVHQSTLGNAASEDVPVRNEVQDGKILSWRWILDAPPIPIFRRFGSFSGNVDRWHYYHYHAPSIAIIDFGSAHTGTGAPEGNREDCMQIYACHFITPVDEHRSIDHWMHIKNFSADEATNAALSDALREAFQEDKTILEAIERNEIAHPDREKVRIAVDAAPVRMRRMVEAMIAAERDTIFSHPSVTEGRKALNS